MTRIEQEKKTVRQMVEIYCHGKKHAPARGSRTGKSLCEACSALLDYAYQRLDHCKFIEGATAAEDEPEVPKRAEAGLTGWIDCYPKCELKGTLFCGGVDGPRTIEGNDKLQEAYEMGKSII